MNANTSATSSQPKAPPLARSAPSRDPRALVAGLLVAVCWLAPTALAVGLLGARGILVALLAIASLLCVFAITRWDERKRWIIPATHLSHRLARLDQQDDERGVGEENPVLAELSDRVEDAGIAWNRVSSLVPPELRTPLARGEISPQHVLASMIQRGTLASIPPPGGEYFDMTPSGEYTTDMVSRLEAKSWRWIESSPTEQEFLGWDLKHLRAMSFLDIVHQDDRKRVDERLGEALVKGEAHGVVVRIRTAQGKMKAIELNVAARLAGDRSVTHLRCHTSDVTDRVRAERELKLRTRELTQLNEQLRQINRELEDLKDRYRDLYHHAPAMYFTLDSQGRVVECNETMLGTLGYRREHVVGHSYQHLLTTERRPQFALRFEEFSRRGTIETESQWVKASGEVIDVWVSGAAILGRDGRTVQARGVAQDITARHRLEAELKEKHERLARTNDELSRKNREMDEFTYVVSHDLQEPLRTLIAFSDFLLKDFGHRLDANGQEYVRHLVDASRRMRALINALLTLSRAGVVTGELGPVNLDEVVSEVKADLAELIREKRATVGVHGPLPTVWGDRDRLGQLLANLIGNGLKYNRSQDPRVEISAGGDDESVTISVRDNGIGIDPQFHTKIFQLFRRLHTREEFEGTGAGLSICAKIVQAHGGRIWVESEPGKGATFLVTLHRDALAERRPEPVLSNEP